MFDTTYTSGGRLDAPHYPTFSVPFVVGMHDTALPASTLVLEYMVPFLGELYSISIDCSKYHNDDKWTLKVDGVNICEDIYVKRAPEGVNLMAFIPVYPGTKIRLEFLNSGLEKDVWCSLHFLKEGDLSKPYQQISQKLSGLSPIKVSEPVIRLYIYDWGNIDGDILNIYLNGALIRKDMYLYGDVAGNGEFGKNYIEVPLQLGDNEIIFEGVTPGDYPPNNGWNNNLTAKFRVKKTDGSVIYDSEELPDLTMEETPSNLDANRRYINKPRVSWIVNRTE